ncbi:MAG: MFS transporter [Frankia sp.]
MTVGNSNQRMSSRERTTFTVVVAAVFMSNLDLFIVNVALPSIGRDFSGNSLANLSWILDGYAIVFAALLVVAGRLGDRTGQRGVFLGGLALFTLSSAACAAAPNLGALVVARLFQAAGAAALIPTSLALLMAASPPEKRGNRIRAWAAVGGLSAALGPVAGGLLVQLDWRWVFLVNLPVGIAAFVTGTKVLPRPPARVNEPLPDVWGAVLLTIAIGALTGGLVEGPTWGWRSADTLGLLVGAAVTLGWFLLRCGRHEHPLVELPLLRIPTYRSASGATFLFSVAFAVMLLSNTLWCQYVWHYSALRAGLAIAPGPAMVPALAIGAGPIVRRYGAGPVAALGNVIFAAGMVWRIIFVSSTPHYLRDLLPGMLLTGIGVGLALPTLIGAAATALPPERFATGSAIVNLGRQVASALGVAVFVTVLGTPATVAATRSAYQHSWLVAAGANVAAAVVCLTLRRPRPVVSDRAPSTPATTSAAPTPAEATRPAAAT